MNKSGRYTILRHDWPEPHFDLLIERTDFLQTWRLASEPEKGIAISAESIFDHRLMYLDYEGPISGGRGSVVAWDRGTFSELSENTHFLLTGHRFCALLEFQTLSGKVVAFFSEPPGSFGNP